MKNIILTVFLVFIFGCASNISNYDSRQISTGMTKEEVVRVIGEPQRVSASRGIETYEYDLKGKAYKACMGGIAVVTLGMAAAECINKTDLFIVSFTNGKVDGYRTIAQ